MGKKKSHEEKKYSLAEAKILLLVAILEALTAIFNLLSAD